MSLTSDLKQVFLKNLTDNGNEQTVPDEFMDDKAQELASGIAQAINAWIKEQTFEITKCKSPITVQQLNSTSTLSVVSNIAPGTVTIGAGAAAAPTPSPIPVNSNLPPLALSNKGGQGGALTSEGTTTINTNPDDSRSQISAVKLKNEVEV